MAAQASGTLEGTADIRNAVERICLDSPIPVDVHTHLYSPRFGGLLLWGFDELVTYHYLIAEVCRTNREVSPEQYHAMSKREQADHIWQSLFLDESPLAEARRGVLTVLHAFGLDVASRDVAQYREFFASTTVQEHVDRVFAATRCERVVMTNDPFDDAERAVWYTHGPETDERFLAALRIDRLLIAWQDAQPLLAGWGYEVAMDLSGNTLPEVRRFLMDWAARMNPVYLAASLGFDFQYPADHPSTPLLEEAVLPACQELGVPFAPMIGVKRQTNPALRLAGDAVGKCDIGMVERLCRAHPDVNFLVTLLSRENQHELCVTARKFPNLMPFGCWWFLNDPSLIEEITRMRVELLGLSFVAQHSDCRILDQLVYKWRHFRPILAKVLTDKYLDLHATGWPLTTEQIEADVRGLLGGSFLDMLGR